MTRHAGGFAWLLLIWTVLVGTVSPLGVLAGAAVSAGLLWFFHPTHRPAEGHAFRLLHVVTFIGYFHVKFIEATLQVALAVIRPERVRRRRAIVAVPIAGASEVTTMLLATAVSLTPGTFILEMRRKPATLYVHVLQLASVRAAKIEILELERRIVRAIGPSGAIERVEHLLASVAHEADAEGDR